MTETEARLTRLLYVLILALLGSAGKPDTETLHALKSELESTFDESVLNG